MKKVILLLSIALIIGISGCIPSLHGLVRSDEDKLVDDRILGSWVLDDESSNNFKIEGSITITSDTESDSSMAAAQKELEDLMSGQGDITSWSFERAGSYTFETPDQKQSMSISRGFKSMCPANMEVVEEELLPYYILTHLEIEGDDTSRTTLEVSLTQIGGNIYMDFIPSIFRNKSFPSRFSSNKLFVHTFAKVEFENGDLNILTFNPEYLSELILDKRLRLKHEVMGEDNILLTASTEDLRAFVMKYGDDPRLYEDYSEVLVKL